MRFLAANAIVVGGAVAWTATLRLPRLPDRLLAFGLLGVTQVTVTMLIAGAVGWLRPGPVLALNAGLSLLAVAIWTWRRRGSAAPGPDWRSSLRRVWADLRSSPWALALVGLAALALGWRGFVAAVLPPYGWDAIWYHLTFVAEWIQRERIAENPFNAFSAAFPGGAELLFAWTGLFLESDRWVDAVQLLSAVLGAMATAGLARLAGAPRSYACAAGAMFVLAPIVLTQASSNYVDLTFSAFFLSATYFLLRFVLLVRGRAEDPALTLLVLSGLAAGLALGTKVSGLVTTAVLTAVLLISLGLASGRARLSRRTALVAVVAFLLPAVAAGGYWYARGLVREGNPVYPERITVLGATVFAGPGLELRTGPAGAGRPQVVHVARSWLHDALPWRYERSARYYAADQGSGGMGMVWLYLMLPALVAAVFILRRRNRPLVWYVAAVFGAALVVLPYPWWSRFTIYLLAAGGVAVALVVSRLSGAPKTVAQLAVVVLCGVSAWMAAGYTLAWGRVLSPREVIDIAGRPAADRTVGALFLPELRWVDRAPQDARIGVFMPENVRCATPLECSRDRAFFSPLYGPRFTRTLAPLRAHDPAELIEESDQERLDYVYVRRGSRFDRWARMQPTRFHLLHADARIAAYRHVR